MKKFLFSAAVVATALVSCSSSDDETTPVVNVQPETPAVAAVMNEVGSLSIEAAGTTMTIAPAKAARTVEGNNAELVGNDLVITLAPVVKADVKSYTVAMDSLALKAKPFDPKTGVAASGHLYAKALVKNNAHEYVKINEALGVTVSNLGHLFDGTGEGLIGVPEGNVVDEWTYEILLYPQILGENNPQTGMPIEITNPLQNIAENEAYSFGNLIGDAPFVTKSGKHEGTDRWGNSYSYEYNYKEAQALKLENSDFKVRVMVYQGDCDPVVNTEGRKLGYDYNYGYLKVSVHVEKKVD